jgi:hypothetical protein
MFNAYRSVDRSVRLLLAWPTQSFLASVSRSMTRIFSSPTHIRVSKWGLLFDEGRNRSSYVGATFVAPQFQHEYIRAVTAFRSPWTPCTLYHCTVLSNIYTRYTYGGFLSMQACAVGYALIYLSTLKLQLVSLISRRSDRPKIKPLIFSKPDFLSNTTYILIYMI